MGLYTIKPKDALFLSGLALILISLAFYCIPFWRTIENNAYIGLFFMNYTITVIYFIMLIGSKRLKKGREGLFPFFLFLVLFLISAWSLNRDMNVFEKAVPWFVALQVLVCVNYIAFAFWASFSRWLQHVMTFVLGVAAVTFLYMSCYLAPIYGYGLLGSLFFGISVHVFVPALFLIYTIVLYRKIRATDKRFVRSFTTGVVIPIVLIAIYVVQWNLVVNSINKTYRQSSISESNELPLWVSVAQTIPQNWVTEKVIKSDLVYSVGNRFWSMQERRFDEQRKHDPLVMIATFFGGKTNLSGENRIQLLKSLYDSRHQAQERLWRGDNLFTQHIRSDVRIWPQFGVSYTEKVITVSNAAAHDNGWRTDQEEAIYTFHLPEGALVTSLSLWIEGKEAKSILTTKQKASEAYTTIVGREMRDPSVLHWQEGNTVSVRVFPVIGGESRKFKVGITAPLTRQMGKMIYENIYFDGPSTTRTTEDIALKFEQQPQNFIAPVVFMPKGGQTFTRSGKYDASWNLELNDQPLSPEAFCFDGKQYTMHPYLKQRSAAVFETVYLDVNSSWTKNEFDSVYDQVKNKRVFVYNNALVQLNGENNAALFEALHRCRFSLFPLHVIKDNTTSLLVSKSAEASPNFDDLEGSLFITGLKKSMGEAKKIKLFNIGNTLSPYLKTLKEYRVFQYEHGTINELDSLIKSQVFARDIEDDNQVVIDNAEVAIVQKNCTQPSVAPDHLMRLFSYNHIMQKMGPCVDAQNDELVAEAQKAHVVSPVSSLVVLESKKDYERFDIADSRNSLKNASIQSKGAVPEPHEWALIIIAILVALAVKYHPVKKNMIS
jgi:XrtN system VIT domain protein